MKVWVEIGPTGLAIQIFRTKKAAVIYAVNPNRGLGPEPNIREMPRELAVGQIRRQIFERDERRCVHCGKELVWERGFPNSMEMDERQARGSCQMNEDGVYCSGQISLANSQTLCHACHTGPGTGKQDRSPSWGHSKMKLVTSTARSLSFQENLQLEPEKHVGSVVVSADTASLLQPEEPSALDEFEDVRQSIAHPGR